MLLALGIMDIRDRIEFLERSTKATGTVAWSTRYHMGVLLPGQTLAVDIRKPTLSLYRRGEDVGIVYDASLHYPGQIGSYGYIDSFAGLWMMPLLLAVGGSLMLLAALLSRNGRFRFSINVGARSVVLGIAAAIGMGSCHSEPVAEVCTEIGCSSGLTVLLEGDVPDEYRVVVKPFARDSVEMTCRPVQPCVNGLFFEGVTRESVVVEVHMGERLVRQTFTVPYTKKRPNGPGCDPECLQGVVTVEV